MKRAIYVVGGLVAIACLGFFLHALARHWSAISEIAWDGALYFGMALALVLYCTTFLTGAGSWQLVLRILGERIGYRRAVGILTISQFAKYLPGNVGHHFGRVLLARRVGLPAGITVASIGLDTVLAISAAAISALGALHMVPDISARYGAVLVRNVAVGGALFALLAFLVLALPAARRHLGDALRRCSELIAAGHRARSVLAWLQYLASFALGALALGCIAAALGTAFPPFAALMGLYAIAWLVGFLVPGAPAGLGVREALLIVGLSPLVGADTATATTALFRVVTVTGDGIAFALGWATAGNEITRAESVLAGASPTSSGPVATKGRDERPEA